MLHFAEKKNAALIGTSQYKVELKKVLKSPLLENPDSDGRLPVMPLLVLRNRADFLRFFLLGKRPDFFHCCENNVPSGVQ